MFFTGASISVFKILESLIQRKDPSLVVVATLFPRHSPRRAIKNLALKGVSFLLFFQPVEGFAGSLEPLVKLVRSVDRSLSRPVTRLGAPAGRVYQEWEKKRVPKDEQTRDNKRVGEGFVLNNDKSNQLLPESKKTNEDLEHFFDVPAANMDSSPILR